MTRQSLKDKSHKMQIVHFFILDAVVSGDLIKLSDTRIQEAFRCRDCMQDLNVHNGRLKQRDA